MPVTKVHGVEWAPNKWYTKMLLFKRRGRYSGPGRQTEPLDVNEKRILGGVAGSSCQAGMDWKSFLPGFQMLQLRSGGRQVPR